ncbi:MAG TPA: hypothetical protein VG994_09420 [Steroidobacteraceae bacterium]|nr:hypothetical protein [Steroidobacteraceae bacterium]
MSILALASDCLKVLNDQNAARPPADVALPGVRTVDIGDTRLTSSHGNTPATVSQEIHLAWGAVAQGKVWRCSRVKDAAELSNVIAAAEKVGRDEKSRNPRASLWLRRRVREFSL